MTAPTRSFQPAEAQLPARRPRHPHLPMPTACSSAPAVPVHVYVACMWHLCVCVCVCVSARAGHVIAVQEIGGGTHGEVATVSARHSKGSDDLAEGKRTRALTTRFPSMSNCGTRRYTQAKPQCTTWCASSESPGPSPCSCPSLLSSG